MSANLERIYQPPLTLSRSCTGIGAYIYWPNTDGDTTSQNAHREGLDLDITWFGRRCFSIRAKDVSVLTDPYDMVSNKLAKVPLLKAVTFSNQAQVGSVPSQNESPEKIVKGPGEYEISAVLITGVGTSYDSPDSDGGNPTGSNTVYAIELEGIVICHLGDLQRPLMSDQVERLGDIGILMVPVGNAESLKASMETMRLIEPQVILPMDYEEPAQGNGGQSEALIRFLKEMGVKEPEGQKRLHITASGLPQQTQVVLLESAA